MGDMKSEYLSGLYQELEDAYNRWFWYYSDSVHDNLGKMLQESEAELIRLWRKYQQCLKEEGRFPLPEAANR